MLQIDFLQFFRYRKDFPNLEVFMKYFMKHLYDVEINGNYELKIIDKNIKLLTLEKDSIIILSKDDYKIKN